jgi:hypothetical protein
MSFGLGSVSLSGLGSLLPDKLLNERSNKIEFKAWYEKIKNYLGCCGLIDVLDGGSKENNNDEQDKKGKSNKSSKSSVIADLEQKSWLAYSIIMSRLDDQLIVQFSTVEKGDAKALMDAINNRFSAVNFFSKLQARRDFNRIKLKSNESISSYGARIKYGAKEIELMDNSVTVSEMELISRLVDGLPEEYDSLIIGLVRGIETISFDEFVTILESKCSLSKLKGGYKGDTNSVAAIGAVVTRSDVGFNGRCYRCNKIGHRKSECDMKGLHYKDRDDIEGMLEGSTIVLNK